MAEASHTNQSHHGRPSVRYQVTGALVGMPDPSILDTPQYEQPPLDTPQQTYDETATENSSLLERQRIFRRTNGDYHSVNSMSSEEDDADSIKVPYNRIATVLGQIPAICLIFMFHLMIGVAFGVSYFPITWRAGEPVSDTGDEVDDSSTQSVVHGPFPLPGKEALGIRMFLFSTVVGQIVYVWTSKFENPIGLQMVENVPFCHALSAVVIRHQGYGLDSLSTLFVLFGLASVIVGAVFYTLGKLKLGRIVFFIPTNVLVGCIGGIGVFLARTGSEITIDQEFSSVLTHLDLMQVVIGFEVVLRILQRLTLDAEGKPRYPLLSPIYFCLITPAFYVLLWVFHVDVSDARDAGYFFPPLDADTCDEGADCSGGASGSAIWNEDLLDIWRVIDFPSVSLSAVVDSMPTMLALTMFSLIHVPINIPAFAVSTNTDSDMNNELIAHGYSNFLVGIFGGLQNYMAYTQSVLYYRSGGTGKASGMAVAAVTSLLFFIGPTIASYVPRCMAGTLLLHVGIDLFLEAVYDSYGKFDLLEYCGIWLITLVMTLYGMNQAMIAGVIAAVATYAMQSIAYLSPVRGSMSAATLRSSNFTRNQTANTILENQGTGRQRILMVQLQGHLFFGNMAHLTNKLNRMLSEREGTPDEPWIVLLDFTLVLGIDTSAAQAIVKLKGNLQKNFGIETCVFVTGSPEGFPCEFDLSKGLTSDESNYTGSFIFDSLDAGLIFAEDVLLYRQDHSLANNDPLTIPPAASDDSCTSEERELLKVLLKNLCPGGPVHDRDVATLCGSFTREEYKKEDLIWLQASPSDCAKLLIRGELIAYLENEAGTSEPVSTGNMIGEVGLVSGLARMSSVYCASDKAILYSLSRASFEELVETKPQAARLVDMICIKYLTSRVQHVSNRIFETRCLPI